MILELSIASFIGLAVAFGVIYRNYSKVYNIINSQYIRQITEQNADHYTGHNPSDKIRIDDIENGYAVVALNKNKLVFIIYLPTFVDYLSSGLIFNITAGNVIYVDSPIVTNQIPIHFNPLYTSANTIQDLGMR